MYMPPIVVLEVRDQHGLTREDTFISYGCLIGLILGREIE